MSVDTLWFKNLLADRRMSQRNLARQLGLDPAAVSLTFRGKREMKISEAAAIARLLGVPADEVMEHAGARFSSKFISVSVGATMDGTAEVHMDLASKEPVPHPGGDLPEHVFACRCLTEGTDLAHMNGWLLFAAHEPEGGINPEAVGRLSICRIRGGGIYVARLMQGSRRGRWTLMTPGGTMRDIEVEWAKPVLVVIP